MGVNGATLLLTGIFTACGIFSIVAGIAGWEWFFNNANVKVLTGRMRRPLARLVYVVLGLSLIHI